MALFDILIFWSHLFCWVVLSKISPWEGGGEAGIIITRDPPVRPFGALAVSTARIVFFFPLSKPSVAFPPVLRKTELHTMVNFPWFPVFERFQGSVQRGKDGPFKDFKGKGQRQNCLTNVKSSLLL